MDTGQMLLLMMPPARSHRSHGPDFSGLGCEQWQEAATAKEESVRVVQSCVNLITKSPKPRNKTTDGLFFVFFPQEDINTDTM